MIMRKTNEFSRIRLFFRETRFVKPATILPNSLRSSLNFATDFVAGAFDVAHHNFLAR